MKQAGCTHRTNYHGPDLMRITNAAVCKNTIHTAHKIGKIVFRVLLLHLMADATAPKPTTGVDLVVYCNS